ncbi:hypothetical protein FTO60_16950 (plasmid) [Octadecabacter sp. SW4]|uniref:hypothetical protein n=1 Tax=Octadecabacter sp. SW4 TaxID=2602067 RepID=UPI0011C1E4C9|nr:hypothetical protein [Octadecabacter sp. SW4]QEE37458.1 hypothetical protein FTO60_16950 [Octadecabacter sp. SW4]
MNTRSTKTSVTFANPFSLPGYVGELPAGEYEVLVEEELLQGLSFEAWRRTSTLLTVRGSGNRAGRTELRAISDSDLKAALNRDAVVADIRHQGGAAVTPQERDQ